MRKVVYQPSTGAVEDAAECCIMFVPDDVPANELDTYLATHAYEVDGSLIGFSEAREMLQLILDAEISDAKVKYQILMEFADAVVNSF